MKIQNQILKDGRKLSFSICGALNGEPVFYFHGFPGSHLEVELTGLKETAEKLNIRMIAVNRPGYGDSDFQRKRCLLDWPDDICELADSFKIEKFSVLGYSGGGPFALACAYKVPKRLKKVIVVSGMGSVYAPGAKKVPSWSIIKLPGFVMNIILKGMKKIVEQKPEKFLSSMNKSLPKVDVEALKNFKLEKDFIVVLKEAFKSGIKGAKHDAKIYRKHWGFKLNGIDHKVHLWHGEEDANVKIKTAQFIASKLPNCFSNFYPKEGHLSLIVNKSNEILETFTK
jgi:pimeloyl-ACP methyl ester carboxylesterase